MCNYNGDIFETNVFDTIIMLQISKKKMTPTSNISVNEGRFTPQARSHFPKAGPRPGHASFTARGKPICI